MLAVGQSGDTIESTIQAVSVQTWKARRRNLTCEVQTLLKRTKTAVWTNHANSNVPLTESSPPEIDRTSWGKKLIRDDPRTLK